MRHAKPGKRHSRRIVLGLIIFLMVCALYVTVMLLLPLPAPQVQVNVTPGAVNTGQAHLEWPAAKQTAVGATGYGLLATHGDDAPLPIASVAKIVTALAVLQKKPLLLNQAGPTITITNDDVAIYNAARANNGSVVPVVAGEELSEYQALQGLLLPSGNNLATTMARWAFGSDEAYLTYANTMVRNLGMNKTHVADASGRSPQTVSTARDLVILGQEAIKHPVIAQIVNQKQATLPVAGLVTNVNTILGVADINGIKTGNTDEAGGCLLFSATRIVAGQPVTVVAAVVAAADLKAALGAAPALLNVSYPNFVHITSLRQDQTVASFSTPWAPPAQVTAKNKLDKVVWKGSALDLKVDVHAGTQGQVGTATLGSDVTQLELKIPVPTPSVGWRLTHPLTLIHTFFSRAQ